MKLLLLPRSKVLLGQPLPWNVRDEQEQLLLKKGHVVETEHQLELLLARGAFVDAEEIRAARLAAGEQKREVSTAPPSLFDMWDKATLTLQKLALREDVATDAPQVLSFGERVDRFTRHVMALVDCQPDIAIYRCVRQEQSHHFYYGIDHALHTSALCLMLARYLQWPAEKALTLVKSALTMNLTIFHLQGQMAAQDVPVKDSQRKLIHGHPTAAVEFLRAKGVAQEDWLTAIAQHHEQVDGSGYPAGIRDVSELAIALRVVDVFMAKISPRILRAPLPSQEAAKQLFREDQGGPLSTAVIKVFGIYPPGEFVRLASGELGVAVQRTANLRAPVVAVITDTAAKPIAHTVRRDTAQAQYAVAGIASERSLLAHLPPERLYGYVTLDGKSGLA